MIIPSDKKWDEKLIRALQYLDKPTYSKSSQELLKEKLFQKISKVRREHELPEMVPWYEILTERIRAIGHETIASPAMKAMLREKILGLLPMLFQRQPVFSFTRWFSLKAWASVILFVFVSMTVFGFFGAPQKVAAAPATYLQSFEGRVEILRNGTIIQARPKFALRDRDVIKTNKDSLAIIHFLDDSLGRLDQDSELRIERLFIHPFDRTNTVVELQLRQGRFWAKVLNLVDEFARFQVKSASAVAVTKKRGAFDMKVDKKGKTTVAAIENTVDVTVANKKKTVLDTTLTDGFSVVVNNGKAEVTESDLKQEDATWIDKNIEADKEYVSEIVERDKETRRETATGLNPVQVISEKTTQVFRSEIDRERTKFQAAKVKLVQAEILFEQGHQEEGEQLLGDFKNLLQALVEKIKTLEKKDPEKALSLKEAYENELKMYKKQLAFFLPDDPAYPLKEAIGEAEVLLAATPEEKTEKTMNVASEQLLDAKELTATGKDELARESIEKFTETVETAQEEATHVSPEEKEKLVSTILELQADHLKLIQALVYEVELKEPPLLGPREQRGISLHEILGQAVKVSVADVNEVVSGTPSETPSEEVLVNGQSVAKTLVETVFAPLPAAPAPAEITPVIVEKPAEQTAGTEPLPLDQVLEPLAIPVDELSGVTVITIEAQPSVPTFSATDSISPESPPAQP